MNVAERVAAIRKIAGYDDEAAHADQDALYVDVLRAIAEGAENPADMAAEALKVEAIEFARWYA